MQMFLLDYGYTDVDKGIVLTQGKDVGKIVSTPIWGALVNTSEGWMLVDTGMNPVHIKQPNATFEGTSLSGKIKPVMYQRNRADECVRACGVDPSDIRIVINSHLHFDHCGGNCLFPKAEFVVQRKHFQWAMIPGNNCPKRDFDIPGVHWCFLDGESEIIPGVHLILTPGHVPYHQSVMIDLPGGPVIIAADAASLTETMTPDAPICADDPELYHASITKLQELASKYDAHILLSHDQLMWEQWPHAPSVFEIN